jgi:IS30 family transposase
LQNNSIVLLQRFFREVNRYGGRNVYRTNKADIAAWERAKRPKSHQLILNKGLAKLVAMTLHRSWSPRQIAGWLMRRSKHATLKGNGLGNSRIGTLVERHSRYVMLVNVTSNKTAAVIDALIKLLWLN